jgi:hypothetical protein
LQKEEPHQKGKKPLEKQKEEHQEELREKLEEGSLNQIFEWESLKNL